MKEMLVGILGDLVQDKPVSNVATNRDESLDVGPTVGAHAKTDGLQTEARTGHDQKFNQDLNDAQDKHDHEPGPYQTKDFLVDAVLGDQAVTINGFIIQHFHIARELKNFFSTFFGLSYFGLTSVGKALHLGS